MKQPNPVRPQPMMPKKRMPTFAQDSLMEESPITIVINIGTPAMPMDTQPVM
jgi:hypothetical protein